jgi:tripartite-type tricarboxylate transporter receptor subunit TctC
MSNIRTSMLRVSALALLGAACLMQSGPTLAQDAYPSRPIKLLVPFSPGGTTDLFARKYAERLGKKLNQPVVPENKAGAAGAIAAAETARAPADGYTLFFASSTTMAILPSLMSKPTYDVERDFAPVALLGITPLMVAVNSSVPAKTLPELLALLRANPGKFSYGTSGTGSANHLVGELFKKIGGVDLLHVPYRGSAPALQDALAGINPIFFDGFVTILPHHKSGKMRILAVFSEQRSKVAPELPTAIEAGMPGMVGGSFQVVVAPAATPAQTLATLVRATSEIMADKSFIAELEAMQFEPVAESTPERTRSFIRSELMKWAPIIKATGAKLD